MPRPTGEYAEQMLEPGGWPEADENVFYDRAQQFTQVLREVTEVLDNCRQQQARIFEPDTWSGGAAAAADGELNSRIEHLMSLQDDITGVVTWHEHVADSIQQTKMHIGDNVEAADLQITQLQNDPALKTQERTTVINAVLMATHTANVGVVVDTAEQIRATKTWQPPRNALPDLLDRQMPPVDMTLSEPTQPGAPGPDRTPPGTPDTGTARPGTSLPEPPEAGEPTLSDPTKPGAEPPAPAPGSSPQAPAHSPASAVIPPSQLPASSAPANPSLPGRPGIPVPDSGAGHPVAPSAPAASAPPVGAGGSGKGLAPASAAVTPPVVAPSGAGVKEDASPAVSPASAAPGAASGSPAPMAPPAAARGGAGSGSTAGGGAPVGQRPMGAHPSSRATSASSRAASPAGPSARPDASERKPAPDAAVVAAIPVSTARAERDAIAAASVADAASRKGSGPDRLRLARQIAAALNAADSGGHNDLGFFWVTGVTTDGAIVVANSYGLAYIPDGVQLPQEVHMATADESVPAPERARWATYPVLAVQGWAAHRGSTLRAVIATEAQFADSDAGVAKVVLAPDDIPDTGAMVGRSRLDVVDPDSARRLDATDDGELSAVLPAPAPSAAPPTDKRLPLWFDVMKPLASTATGREVAHLRAFRTYAAHSEEVALTEAHRALDPEEQRSAVATWLYWRHLTRLLDDVVAAAA